MDKSDKYIHRDLSWLSFNARVLQEASDRSVPLFERIKFLAIYSANLDEFFRVRVANLHNLIRLGKKMRKALDFVPEQILDKLHKTVESQLLEHNRIFDQEIIPELRQHRVHILRRTQLNTPQKGFLEKYFSDTLSAYVQPVLLEKQKIRPFLTNASLYLAVTLYEKANKEGAKTYKIDKNGKPILRYAIVKIPSDYLPRFIELPDNTEGEKCLIFLDDVVRHCLPLLFTGFYIIDSYSFKLSRDAELYIDNEYAGNLLDKIKAGLAKRNIGPAARFVYDRQMPQKLITFLMEMFELEKDSQFAEGRYHNNFDLFKFPNLGLTQYTDAVLAPISLAHFTEKSIFDNIRKQGDVLLHFPYHTFDYVSSFFEQAADDPQVVSIKITQYRVSDRSQIMQALMRAAKAGKEVTVFVEVKARFDEELNLRWADQLEKAGAKVLYSFPGLKVHAKVAIVTRKENGILRDYLYLSTGNFNEKTAKIYVDFGLFSTNEILAKETHAIFYYLATNRVVAGMFNHLLVGQFNLQTTLLELIDNEILNAKKGLNAYILLKMNSLEDKKMIDKLYLASQAGVKIDLIVRGIFCLKSGVKGLSDNINSISIIDRFLEHTRAFYFYNNGNDKLYLSSADWMVRNLHYRIETAFPIDNPTIKQEILYLLRLQLEDNVKGRILDAQLENNYNQGTEKQDFTSRIRSQIVAYDYWKEKAANVDDVLVL